MLLVFHQLIYLELSEDYQSLLNPADSTSCPNSYKLSLSVRAKDILMY